MSGRIRTIKPEWLEDELLAAASDEARVLSVALILMADDYGRGRASRASLANGAWRFQMERNDGAEAPEVLARASRALTELVAIRFVTVYEVAGQRYFEIRNWSKHQKVDRPSRPRIPEPPAEEAAENRGETPLASHSRATREEPPRDSAITREPLATDLRPVPPTSDLRPGSAEPAPTREGAMAERAELRAFDARCERVRLAVDRECRAVRRSPPPPACTLQSHEITAVARWLSTAGEVDVDAMVRRWAQARDRKGGWAPLRWLSNDPTEYAFPAPSDSAVRLTSEQEDASIEDFISAGTRRAEVA